MSNDLDKARDYFAKKKHAAFGEFLIGQQQEFSKLTHGKLFLDWQLTAGNLFEVRVRFIRHWAGGLDGSVWRFFDIYDPLVFKKLEKYVQDRLDKFFKEQEEELENSQD